MVDNGGGNGADLACIAEAAVDAHAELGAVCVLRAQAAEAPVDGECHVACEAAGDTVGGLCAGRRWREMALGTRAASLVAVLAAPEVAQRTSTTVRVAVAVVVAVGLVRDGESVLRQRRTRVPGLARAC
jgi:hypothetical protein